jgi:hypothetical protein
MKIVARTVALEREDEVKDTSDHGRSAGSCGLEKDRFSDDEAIKADKDDHVKPCDEENEKSAESNMGLIGSGKNT